LTLERTLPFDVRPEYLPEILPQTGTVYDVGIEGLTFKFPFAYYGGHHYEDGYNCIQLWEVSEGGGGWGPLGVPVQSGGQRLSAQLHAGATPARWRL
jgi:hypothetical protein